MEEMNEKMSNEKDICLWFGDCLDVMDRIESGSVDMVLCDLPYGTTKAKWDVVIDFKKLWEQYKRICKNTSPIILFGTEPFSSLLRTSNLDIYRYDWYWQKDKGSNFLFGNKQPMKVIETISVFYKNQPIYKPIKTSNPKGTEKRSLSFGNMNQVGNSKMAEELMPNMPKRPIAGKTYEADKLLPKQILYFSREQKNKLHPTQKPVLLLEYLIRTYTNQGNTILDNTMGSGSTGVAAKQLNRKFIGIEKEQKYYDLAVNRIMNETVWGSSLVDKESKDKEDK